MLKPAGVIACLVVVAVQCSGALDAETLYCSTSFQGYHVCSSPGGATSTEWQWQGMTIGQDSEGNRWTTSRWRDGEITTVTPSER
jgi:hypothetical protein